MTETFKKGKFLRVTISYKTQNSSPLFSFVILVYDVLYTMNLMAELFSLNFLHQAQANYNEEKWLPCN